MHHQPFGSKSRPGPSRSKKSHKSASAEILAEARMGAPREWRGPALPHVAILLCSLATWASDSGSSTKSVPIPSLTFKQALGQCGL